MNNSEKIKRSFKKFEFTNNIKSFDETKYQSHEEIFNEERDWLILPKESKKIELPFYDPNFGSKSTRAQSKKTHNKPILLKDLKAQETQTLISESIFEDGLSNTTKSIIDNIIAKKKNNLIYQNKISFNNEQRFSLLKTLSKNKQDKKPKISDKTKSIIESLKKEKDSDKNEFNFINDENKSKEISLIFKYEELIDNPRKLPLPIQYKQLYNIFISLDIFISIVKINHEKDKNTFINFRNYMKITHSLNITINHLKQILFVVPYSFIIKFIKSSNNGENLSNIEEKIFKNHDLLIDVPKNYKEFINKTFPKNFNYISLFYYLNFI